MATDIDLVAAIPAPHLEEHYANLDQQSRAARFGMWIFLSTEILLFGGLLAGYAVYRGLFESAFAEASKRLDVVLGTIETAVLLTSSLFAVLALHYLRVNRLRLVLVFLILTIGLGWTFLVLHGFEYAHEFKEGIMPGAHYHYAELPTQGANLFFTLYFLLTGLHGAHVVVGSGILVWMVIKVVRGQLSAAYDTPLEVSALYWHLVDIVWIFLWPLLYLAG